MTISPFALIPKMCDRCGRWFIFEKYKIGHKLVGIEQAYIKIIICEKCRCRK